MLGEGLLDASSAAPIQRWALSRSGCGDRERTQHPYVEVVGVHQLAGLADGRPPLEHRLQGDATFEPGQRHPEAVMEAVTERDVLSVWAVEHESVGVGKASGLGLRRQVSPARRRPPGWSAALVTFTADERAGRHCEPMARSLLEQRMFDWLDETLASDLIGRSPVTAGPVSRSAAPRAQRSRRQCAVAWMGGSSWRACRTDRPTARP